MKADNPTHLKADQAPPAWIHRFAVATAILTFVLVCAGGLVKSKGAGLSVPGWPFSYGQPNATIALTLFLATIALGLLWTIFRHKILAYGAILFGIALAFTFYIFGPGYDFGASYWYTIPTIRAEHGHRLIAGTVGFMMAILAGLLWTKEQRAWVRYLALAALLAVIVQAVLGGLTVHYLLPAWISASHGSLAQAFFGMVVALAVVTGKGWFEVEEKWQIRDGKSPRRMALWMTGAIFLQIMLGTSVRHTPYVVEHEMSALFMWHLGSHLFGFLWVCHTVAKISLWANRNLEDGSLVRQKIMVVAGLLFFQIMLGIGALFVRLTSSVDSQPSTLREWTATAHVAMGGLMLISSVICTLYVYRTAPTQKPAALRGDQPSGQVAVQ